MKEIEGGICAVPGVRACGVKQGKHGLALIACSGAAAGLFTTNKVRAAPCDLTSANLAGGHLEGIIANSGCANAFTGPRGLEDAGKMAGILAKRLGVDISTIGVASTGVIGRYLDLDLIEEQAGEVWPALRSDHGASLDAARAIMTTDTREKVVAVEHGGVRVAGICKGAGMIEPNMATMLAFLYTDARLSPEVLKCCLVEAVDKSFNMLTVDGDTSTNDMAVITSTGLRSCEADVFQDALDYVCVELARKMARDGEGATKYMETVVSGALNGGDARKAAKAVALSNLVKAALYGQDPNWGRIVAAVGRSGAMMDPERVTLRLAGGGREVTLVDSGRIVEGVLERAEEVMASEEILIYVDLGLGDGEARSFGCDLTHDYVDINASYTT